MDKPIFMSAIYNKRGCFGKQKTLLNVTFLTNTLVRFDCQNNTRTSITCNLETKTAEGVVFSEEPTHFPIPPSDFVVRVVRGAWEIIDKANPFFLLKFKYLTADESND